MAFLTFEVGIDRTPAITTQDAGQLAAWLADTTVETGDPSFNALGGRIDHAVQESAQWRGAGHVKLSEVEREKTFEVLQQHGGAIAENSMLDLFRKALQGERIARIARTAELDDSS
jgi:hypothetical protein